MEKLELKVPPVLLFFIFAGLMYLLNQHVHHSLFNLPYPIFVLSISIVVATVIGMLGVYEFRKAKTTVNPVKPETASAVVDSGIFSITRNPMYLGMFLVLFGIGYWQQNILCLLLSFGFVIYMNRFQIEPEERALEKLFGAEYVDYKQRVRRWI
ncbi:methyltransferase family protein [Vibrio paucivorans]